MAAAEVLAWVPSLEGNRSAGPNLCSSTTAWHEPLLRAQLSLISLAWVVDRQNAQTFATSTCRRPRPLWAPDCSPRWSRRLPAASEMQHHLDQDTDAPARQQSPDGCHHLSLPPSAGAERERSRRGSDLFLDPVIDISVDWSSQQGISELKGKKKNPKRHDWGDDSGEKKGDDEGKGNGEDQGDGGNAGDGDKAGTGNGDGNGDKDKDEENGNDKAKEVDNENDKDKDGDKDGDDGVKDDVKSGFKGGVKDCVNDCVKNGSNTGAGDANPEDEWATAKPKKKKGRKGGVISEPVAPPSANSGDDAIHNSKSDDDLFKLDVKSGAPSVKDPVSCWGATWVTGGGAAGSGKDGENKDESNSKPWSFNRGKRNEKNKPPSPFNTFNSLCDADQDSNAEASTQANKDDFGFTSALTGNKNSSTLETDFADDTKDPLVTQSQNTSNPSAWSTTGSKMENSAANVDEPAKEGSKPGVETAKKQETDDNWAVWPSSKRDKKKKKKKIPCPDDTLAVTLAPATSAEPKPDEIWGTVLTKKGKTNKNKTVSPESHSVLDPNSEERNVTEPDLEIDKKDDNVWESSKRDNEETSAWDEADSTQHVQNPALGPLPEEYHRNSEVDNSRGSIGTRKHRMNGDEQDLAPSSTEHATILTSAEFLENGPDNEPQKKEEDDFWPGLTTSKKEKKKKKKKGLIEQVPDPKSVSEPPAVNPKPEKEGDDVWGTSGTKKDEKRKDAVEGIKEDQPSASSPAEQTELFPNDDSWGVHDAKSKGKKGGFVFTGWGDEKMKEQTSSAKDVAGGGKKEEQEDWDTFSTSSKDKKKKNSELDALKQEPRVEEPKEDVWGSDRGTTFKRNKKKRNGTRLNQLGQEDDDEEATEKFPKDTVEATGDNSLFSSRETGNKEKKRHSTDDTSCKPNSIEAPSNDLCGAVGKQNKYESKTETEEILDAITGEKVQLDAVGGTKDSKVDGDDKAWASSAKKKTKPRKEASADPSPPTSQPPYMDLNLNESGDQAGEPDAATWDESSASKPNSESKDKETSKKDGEPKLSEKELKKLEREKKKAEKEKLEQEAKEAAEREMEEQAAREAEEKARPEEEEKARVEAEAAAVAQEESELAALTDTKKRRGRLTKKDTQRLKHLTENAAERAEAQVAREAEELAAKEAEERAARQAEEQAARVAEETEAAKRTKKGASKAKEKAMEKEKEKEKKERERERERGREEKEREREAKEKEREEKETEKEDKEKDNKPKDPDPVPASFGPEPELSPEEVEELLSPNSKPTSDAFSFWGVASGPKKAKKVLEDATVGKDTTPLFFKTNEMKARARKSVGGAIADKLRNFETVHDAPADVVPPPPPPPPPSLPKEDKEKKSSGSSSEKSRDVDEAEHHSFYSKKSHRLSESPGSFPANDGEDEMVDVADMASRDKSKGSRKSKLMAAADDVPPPPPPVPDAPLMPPPEPKTSKKEGPKIKDDNASWARWNAALRKEEKKSSRIKSDKPSTKPSTEKTPSKDSGSDKAVRADKTDKTAAKPRPSGLFSTPPIARSMSTREKRTSASGNSSRRYSVDVHELASPSRDDPPEMSSKAAKVLGVEKSSSRKKSRKATPPEDDDLVMVGALDADAEAEPAAPKREKRRSKRAQDDDIVIVDAGGPSEAPMKRGASASKRSGFASLFSGLMTPKSARVDAHGDLDAGSGGIDRAWARKAKRSEREAAEKASEELRRSKDDARRERRRKREDDDEARRLEAKETRRAEKRAARQREEEERRATGERDARRAERRRLRKAKEAAILAAERGEEEAAAKQERRRSQHGRMDHASEDEVERRRKRESRRRASRAAEGSHSHRRKSSRRQGEQVGDEHVYPHKDGQPASGKGPAWPHSGTSSWVKDHSDAPPPPVDEEQARREARRAKHRSKYGDGAADEADDRRRRRRREERGREKGAGGSEGSDERHQKRRSPAFMDATPRSSWWRKLAG